LLSSNFLNNGFQFSKSFFRPATLESNIWHVQGVRKHTLAF
jgi:hypothetical protein